MISPQQLLEIESRAEAATKGPWMEMFSRSFQKTPESFNTPVWTFCGTGPVHHEKLDLSKGFADMKFIAHARTDIPKLIAEVRWLQKELKYTGDYID